MSTTIQGASDTVEVTHPAWCAPSQCAQEWHRGTLVSVYHWSMANVWGSPPDGDHDADLTYIRVDDTVDEAGSEATTAFFKFSGSDVPMTVDQVESLGLWLTTEATVMRREIAAETTGDAALEPTVLCPDPKLTVKTAGDCVVMSGQMSDDGDWWFSPAEARAFATALIAHAAQAEEAESDE